MNICMCACVHCKCVLIYVYHVGSEWLQGWCDIQAFQHLVWTSYTTVQGGETQGCYAECCRTDSTSDRLYIIQRMGRERKGAEDDGEEGTHENNTMHKQVIGNLSCRMARVFSKSNLGERADPPNCFTIDPQIHVIDSGEMVWEHVRAKIAAGTDAADCGEDNSTKRVCSFREVGRKRGGAQSDAHESA